MTATSIEPIQQRRRRGKQRGGRRCFERFSDRDSLHPRPRRSSKPRPLVLFVVMIVVVGYWHRTSGFSFHLPPRIDTGKGRLDPIASSSVDNHGTGTEVITRTDLLQEEQQSLTSIDLDVVDVDDDVSHTDNQRRQRQLPYEQRTNGPRKARRQNHSFRYLYRDSDARYMNVTAMEYLQSYYSHEKILEMNSSFPPLLDLNVSRHIHPKIRFLQETMLRMGTKSDDDNSNDNNDTIHGDTKENSNIKFEQLDVPPQYFGSRLEKVIAPRHAFLALVGLPHGLDLLLPSQKRWHDFLLSCRKTKQFCVLCNSWGLATTKTKDQDKEQRQRPIITTKQIEAFDAIFGRGLLAASRGELAMHNNTWKLEQNLNVTAAKVAKLLIQHGANPLERDVRGVSLMHWACGTGNVAVLKVLLPYFDAAVRLKIDGENFDDSEYFADALLVRTERDGATCLHWAAAGANSKEFGTGGHVDICEFILTECEQRRRNRRQDASAVETTTPSLSSSSSSSSTDVSRTKPSVSPKDLVNQLTKDGNSPLMWAAWSGSLDTVKLMVRHRADTAVTNRNGCSVAHWAASGGSVEVCQYLGEVVGVDFFRPNYGGNTPLTHAVAFGRVEVVEWIRRRAVKMGYTNEDGGISGDTVASQLANDFVEWNSDGDASKARKRRQILEMFVVDDDDDVWDDTVDSSSNIDFDYDDGDGNKDRAERLSLEEAQKLELDQF